MARNVQEWIHWLEAGAGSRVLRLAAVLLGVLLLSILVAWKQFHGPASEETLLQADLGRQLALGQGFTTLVNYPQTAALLAARGVSFEARKAYPELHHAPLYATLIGISLWVLPEATRDALFAKAPIPPDGFAADYYLLGLNLVLFWVAAWQCFHLARCLFSARVAWVSCLAFVLSATLWQRVVSLDGTLLLIVLGLGTFQVLVKVDAGSEDKYSEIPYSWLAGLGLVSGLLFLAEYCAGAFVLVALAYVAWRFRSRGRKRALLCVVLGALLVAGPWLVRNYSLSGNPLGLASQQLALKAGDATAEPSLWRASYSVESPSLSPNKLANKVLTQLQDTLKVRFWTGGALLLTAFFVTGMLYQFRSAQVDRLRWVFVATLAWLVLVQALFNSGESEHWPVVYLAPLVIIFGTGFFFVLVESSPVLTSWPGLAAAGLLMLQAIPLVHDTLEPRRIHFHYPPYFPTLFVSMREDLERCSPDKRYGTMADVPAGMAWYGRQRCWAQPPSLRDFYRISVEQPIAQLLLTPKTLDRPFFSELNARPVLPAALIAGPSRFGEWGQIYAALFTGRLPQEFPLRNAQKVSDNLYVLMQGELRSKRLKD